MNSPRSTPTITATARIVDARNVQGTVTVEHPRAGSREYPATLSCGRPHWEPSYRWSVAGVPRALRNAALNAFGDAAETAVAEARRKGRWAA